MKDLQKPELVVRMKIIRDRNNFIIEMNQLEYSQKILERFNMTESKTRNIPMHTPSDQKKDQKWTLSS